MRIDKLNINANFRYFWLKNVKGVDLSKHCAQCLIGYYVKPVPNIPLFGDIYYMCGVTKPYVWENNFHLAFRNKPGSIININRNGVSVIIKDAEEIEINTDCIDQELYESISARFKTCRNWQFANWYNSKVMKHR